MEAVAGASRLPGCHRSGSPNVGRGKHHVVVEVMNQWSTPQLARIGLVLYRALGFLPPNHPPNMTARPLSSLHRFWSVLAMMTAISFISACSDEPPMDPPSASLSEHSADGDSILPIVRPDIVEHTAQVRTIRDEFAEMARRTPGGLGGVYVDPDGVPTVVLQDPGRRSAALSALEAEPFFQHRRHHAAFGHTGLRQSRVGQGDFR